MASMEQILTQNPTADERRFMAQRETIHDLRNLFGLVGSAKHLLEDHPAEVRRRALLQAIENAAIRGGEMTTSLLAQDRCEMPLTRVDLNDQIRGLEPLIRTLATQRVSFDLCKEILPVRIDADAVDAVLFELLANAQAAKATRVTIRTRRADARCWLMVADNGGGMEADVLARVQCCEDRMSGHGAGLCRVWRFVSRSHGRLHIRSRAGCGTVVSMTLPTVLVLTVSEPRNVPPR